jgi:hypothetical protein
MVESFNGRFRAEYLDQDSFGSLYQARTDIEEWGINYNSRRPHFSLGYLPPDLCAEKYYQKNEKSILRQSMHEIHSHGARLSVFIVNLP